MPDHSRPRTKIQLHNIGHSFAGFEEPKLPPETRIPKRPSLTQVPVPDSNGLSNLKILSPERETTTRPVNLKSWEEPVSFAEVASGGTSTKGNIDSEQDVGVNGAPTARFIVHKPVFETSKVARNPTAVDGAPDAILDRRGGFFPHEIVACRGASVTMRGNQFYVGSSEKPIAALEEAVQLRRDWLIEKRNYERKLSAKHKHSVNIFQFRRFSTRADGEAPEHYIPGALPQDEDELFSNMKDRQTGQYIDDCMEEATKCVFLGLDDPPPTAPLAVFTVDELNLPRKMKENLASMNISELLPIQRQVIPLIRAGFDVIGTSPTGSGKTAAFLVPIIESLFYQKSVNPRDTKQVTQALILCPTRELAVQINQAAVQLAYSTGVTSMAIYGSIDSEFLRNGLNIAPDIIVATPGRVLDVLQSKLISLQNISYVVIDEVDRMITGRSFPEVTLILEHATFPEVAKRRTLFFSATIPEEQLAFLKHHQSRPFSVRVGLTGLSLGITQIFEKTRGFYEKIDKLRQYLDTAVKDEKTVIVFAGTKSTVDRLHEYLKGFPYLISHGDLTQASRADVMKKFTSKEVSILVASDLCSRGLDIEGVALIINFNMPHSPEDYIHRVGRSGRKGHEGTAVTFYDPTSKRDGTILQPLVLKLHEGGVTLPSWIDQELNEVRHARLNNGLKVMEEPNSREDANDLADLNVFLCLATPIPVVTCDWLRTW